MLAGHSDWHLPTKEELKDLVYCSNEKPTPLNDNESCQWFEDPSNPSWDELIPFKIPTWFPGAKEKRSDWPADSIYTNFLGRLYRYWTSTTNNNGEAWTVNFEYGTAQLWPKDNSEDIGGATANTPGMPAFVRCVR